MESRHAPKQPLAEDGDKVKRNKLLTFFTKDRSRKDSHASNEVLVTHDIIITEKSDEDGPLSGTLTTKSWTSYRTRSQPIPKHLEAVFSSGPTSELNTMADMPGAFAWRPPRRSLEVVRKSGIRSFDQIKNMRDDDDLSVAARASNVSSLSSGPDGEPTLPIMHQEPSPLPVRKRDSVLVKESELDVRRWTYDSNGGSLYEEEESDGVFIAVPLPAIEPREMSDIPTARLSRTASMRAAGMAQNFSRPRTAAAAAMQEKVEKRLMAAKRRESIRRYESRESVSTVGTSILGDSSRPASWRTRRSTYSFQTK
jgi:hypothetical protein